MILKGSIFLVSAVITSVFLINFCAMIYGCGCTFLWAGADTHCNIHTGPKHCPWCSIGMSGFAGVYLTIIAAQAIAAFGPWALSWPGRLGMTIAAFPAAGTVVALVVGLYKRYWF